MQWIRSNRLNLHVCPCISPLCVAPCEQYRDIYLLSDWQVSECSPLSVQLWSVHDRLILRSIVFFFYFLIFQSMLLSSIQQTEMNIICITVQSANLVLFLHMLNHPQNYVNKTCVEGSATRMFLSSAGGSIFLTVVLSDGVPFNWHLTSSLFNPQTSFNLAILSTINMS